MRQHTSGIISGFRIQLRIIKALMLREMIVRNGRENIGFGWVLLEPMILCSGVMVVWSLTVVGAHGSEDISVVEMVLTGYMPLTLWRHMTNPAVGIFTRAVPLLYHRLLTPFDILIAKLALEFLGTTAAFILVWGALYAMGLVSAVANLGLLALGWLMMGLLGAAGSAILATVTERWEAAERFVQPSQYLMVPLSGCFFLTDWVPSWARDLLLLNPMVHCYEVVRAGFFGDAHTFHYDFGYFFACTFVLLFAGFFFVDRIKPWIRIN